VNETECRIIAYEMALIEVAAYLDEDIVEAALRAIRSGLVVGIADRERTIRLHAIDLLELANERADMRAATGLRWRESPAPARDAGGIVRALLNPPDPPPGRDA
jgi:hypothetical protein